MKRFTLSILAFSLSAAVMAQKPSLPLRDVSRKQSIDLQDQNMLKVQTKFTQHPSTPGGGLRNLTYVALGSAANGLTVLNNEANVVSVDKGLNSICFVHRNDPAATGSGTSSNYRFDFSKDGGFTFANNLGPLNPSIAPGNPGQNGRYPQCVLFNPSSTANADSLYLAYEGTWHNGGADLNVWDGVSIGVSNVNATGITESYPLIDNGNISIFTSMCESTPGTFWAITQEWDADDLTTNVNDSNYVVLKGVWNAGTRDVDWNIATIIHMSPDLSFDGSTYDLSPLINFAPNGQDGWIVLDGDFVNDGQYVYAPVFIGTTDGGNTWSAPAYIDLNNFQSITDILDPGGSGVPTTGFDADLTVDSYGNPHFAVVVGSGADNAIESGLSHHVFDITRHGDNYEAYDLGQVYTFRGFVGSGSAGDYTEDNRVQATRTEDGKFLYFSWIDTDTLLVDPNDPSGYTNNYPDLWTCGEYPESGFVTAATNVTVGTDFDTKAFMPMMAPTCLRTTNDDGSVLPIVVLQPNDNGSFESSTYFWYLNNVSINDSEFPVGIPSVNAAKMEVAQNYPNPFADQTQINITLVKSSNVNLKVTNTLGQEVSNTNFSFSAGTHGIVLSKGNLSSGVYNFTVTADGNQVTKTMIIQ